MYKLIPEVFNRFPCVRIFLVNDTKIGDLTPCGVHYTHLISSNGINMLCCNDSGNVYVVALRHVKKVSPQNNDYFRCSYDSDSGCVLAESMTNNTTFSSGPVHGQPDPRINLSIKAQELGLTLGELFISEVNNLEHNVSAQNIITTKELDDGPADQHSAVVVEDLNNMSEAMGLLDSLNIPDLADLI